MQSSSNFILNRFFTKNMIKSLINECPDAYYFAVLRQYINNFTDKNHKQIISEIYKQLKKNYRNEYFYKNTLLNKLLFGIHSPNTTTALIEVPINKSKADFILINGKAVVYEIKTELDTFERLDSQLHDYFKAFPNVCVVTSEENIQSIEKKLTNSNVGIYMLTTNNTLKQIRPYLSDYSKLEHESLFKILRKNEYENIINHVYNKLPKVSDFEYYAECKKLFKQIDIIEAYNMSISEFKKRNKIDVNLIKNVPVELKSIMYFSKFKKDDFIKLNNFLSKGVSINDVFSIS